MMFLLENRDFPRSYLIPGRCEKTPHRHGTTRKQKGTTMSRHVLFTLTLLTVNMDAENWENVRMCYVSGFCYFFSVLVVWASTLASGMQKKTKFEFICSIHVSVTYIYIYICQGSTNIDAQTGYFEQYSANMDIHSKILGFRQVSCGGVSNDSIPWQSCKKKRDTTRFWNRCFWWQSYLAMFC